MAGLQRACLPDSPFELCTREPTLCSCSRIDENPNKQPLTQRHYPSISESKTPHINTQSVSASTHTQYVSARAHQMDLQRRRANTLINLRNELMMLAEYARLEYSSSLPLTEPSQISIRLGKYVPHLGFNPIAGLTSSSCLNIILIGDPHQ